MFSSYEAVYAVLGGITGGDEFSRYRDYLEFSRSPEVPKSNSPDKNRNSPEVPKSPYRENSMVARASQSYSGTPARSSGELPELPASTSFS